MLSSPTPGTQVELRYRPSMRSIAPHGQRGVVVIVSKKRPRNHAVRLESGTVVVVPAGNLFMEKSQCLN